MTFLRRELARVTKERDSFTRSGRVLRERIDMKYRMIPRCRFVFGHRRRVVDERATRTPGGLTSCAMALWQRPDRTPVILRSEHGCQFSSEEYQQFLEGHNVVCSMSAVGSCVGNAAAESFFGVLKRERVNRQHYQTRAAARADIIDYIQRCHNPRPRRRLEMQERKQGLLTQPSVITG